MGRRHGSSEQSVTQRSAQARNFQGLDGGHGERRARGEKNLARSRGEELACELGQGRTPCAGLRAGAGRAAG